MEGRKKIRNKVERGATQHKENEKIRGEKLQEKSVKRKHYMEARRSVLG